MSTGNVRYWDELANIHARSKEYDLEGSLRAKSTLRPIELELLGDLKGRSVLHVHCHLGQDTLSLAKLARHVVGVDYSAAAVAHATALAKRMKIKNVAFVRKDVQRLASSDFGSKQFDLALASYGVLMWVRDLDAWTRSVGAQLRPGGRLILVEEHPFAAVFAGRERAAGALKLESPYSSGTKPYLTKNKYSYADRAQPLVNQTQRKWNHGFSKLFRALRGAHFRIDQFDEHFRCFYQILPDMTQSKDGYWVAKTNRNSLPLMYSLAATRE